MWSVREHVKKDGAATVQFGISCSTGEAMV